MKTLAGMSIVAMLLLLFCVWERVEIVRVGYQIEHLKKQKVQLQRERDELRVRVSSLLAPERIARAAAEELGMEAPKPGQVVLVKVDSRTPALPDAPLPELRLAKSDGVGSMGRMP
jgi:cell division protein FtsL